MSTISLQERLEAARSHVREQDAQPPKVGLVLGSGLGAFADDLEQSTRIPYPEIPHMPAPTVAGHAGKLCLGQVGTVRVACLQGRVHLYEGHEPERLVFAVRLLARLGCSTVLLTNAAGGINATYSPGTLMLIRDHINLTGVNPLHGPNPEGLGPRFPDMTAAYDPKLRELAQQAAQDIDLNLAEGVYAAVHGPSYETPAEIHMLRTVGADAVGMSTVPEVIALRHMGVSCAAISCITNMAAGMGASTLDHAEVQETATATRDVFVNLLRSWITRIGDATD